jgi:methyltransferase (TIGR00027 family)
LRDDIDMRPGRPSASAEHIALARAHLTRMGVLQDPAAERFLSRRWKIVLDASRDLGFGRFFRGIAMGYLAARTAFYDRFVNGALDDGIRQVVLIAAGYDTRAWRLARDDVRFIEVDHPDTQHRKQALAPPDGPTYAAADLSSDDIAGVLSRAGFRDEPSAFTCEGLTGYLERASVEQLLGRLAGSSPTGSRLAVDFAVGPGPRMGLWRVAWQLQRAIHALGGEPIRFELEPTAARGFLEAAGWTAGEVLTGPQMYERFVAHARLHSPPGAPGAYVVSATKH